MHNVTIDPGVQEEKLGVSDKAADKPTALPEAEKTDEKNASCGCCSIM